VSGEAEGKAFMAAVHSYTWLPSGGRGCTATISIGPVPGRAIVAAGMLCPITSNRPSIGVSGYLAYRPVPPAFHSASSVRCGRRSFSPAPSSSSTIPGVSS
jgi:hypothetical protein